MDKNNQNRYYNSARLGMFAACLMMIIGVSCTTQEFEYAEANKDVYRIKIVNTSDKEITYTPEISLYYADGKKNVEVPEGTISPGDPEILLYETKEGTYGVSVDVDLDPIAGTLRLFLEKGTGTGDDFEFEEVVQSQDRDITVILRYGEYY